MVTLRTYGDSHASEHGGWKSIDINGLNIITNWLGPKLMFSFSRDKNIVVKGKSPEDILIFCFGEIDCRCHINKFKPDWADSIDNIVNTYFDTIKLNIGNHSKDLVFIYNVVPPIEREHPDNLWMIGKSALPALGSDKDRKIYTTYMNEKLKEKCLETGFRFFDVYNKYINDDGFLTSELSDDNCHIKNPIHIKEELIKILNEKK